MTQRTTVLCTNTINSMVFAARPQLPLEIWLVFETRLLWEEIRYAYRVHVSGCRLGIVGVFVLCVW